ncbi:MAG: 3-dehydroquinate synthase, partial [Candidatus Aenigmarchaeota archaeon]|nr:3-dehydroquinate synthase [Candidatus Aenigmarchaeota archaeon]
GGKTAINLPEGKNTVGAFHQPRAVFCDLRFLDTLPRRECNSGLMEIIKYGLILDSDLYDFIKKNKEKIREKNTDTIAYLIYRSCQLKSQIVAEDEKDKGVRNILNFGHTIGHALESYTNYEFYLHGEAVSLGSLVIVHYLAEQGILSRGFLREFVDILSFFELPTSLPAEFEVGKIIERLQSDKKIRGGKIQWVTLKRVGVAVRGQSVDQKEVEEIMRRLQKNE